MRVATITAPKIPLASRQLERNILLNFGGYTAVDGRGAWYDENTGITYHDNVTVYSCAMNDGITNADTWRAMAKVYGQDAKQRAVFLTYANGDAEIVEIDQDPTPPPPLATMARSYNPYSDDDDYEG